MAGIEVFEKSKRYADHMSGDLILYPEKLILELTTKSPSNCHCPKPLMTRMTVADAEMTPETLDYILTNVLPYVQMLHLTGRGDPLLATKNLIETLNCAREFSVPVIIDTHGLSFTDDILECILNSTVQRINVTVNAPDEKNFKEICGCDMAPLLETLEKLSDLRKKQSIIVPEIHFRMVATKNNIELLPEFINFAYRYESTSLIVLPMSLSMDPEKLSAFRYYRDTAEEVIYRSLIESEMKGFCLQTEPHQLLDAVGGVDDLGLFLSGQIPPDANQNDYIRDCSCMWTHTIIDAEGNVLPCNGDFPPIGNIARQSFQDIWYGHQIKAIRRNYVTGFNATECLACHNLIWRKKRAAKHAITPHDPNFFLFPGWFETELEEKDFRFTRDRAAAFLQRAEDHLFVLIQMRKASFENAPSSGRVLINNSDFHDFELQSNQWETLEFPLPDNGDSNDMISLEVIPNTTARSIDLGSDHQDYRSVGVKVSRIWLESWSKKVVFSQQLVLLGYEISPDTWEVDGDVVFRTFWRTLSQGERDVKILVNLQHEDNDQTVKKAGSKTKSSATILQNDFLLEHRGLGSSNWPAGTFIAHEFRLPLSADLKPGHYRIHLGVYPEGDPKKRVTISRSDREHQDNLALLGTVMISQQKR